MKYTAAFLALSGAAVSAATIRYGLDLSTSVRPALTYTDDNGVMYYQDSHGQWHVYPSPTPEAVAKEEHSGPGSSIEIDGLSASGSGDNSVSVGATEDSAAAAGNGLNAVLAAAMATPGTPGALGFAF